MNANPAQSNFSKTKDAALVKKLRSTGPQTFAGRIVTEGLLLYCRDESARVEFEVQIRKKYFDFLPVIEQYHQEYLNKVRQ
ncbi:MAG: hypothetical protein KFF46_05545 [Desulfobacterales bacterium]|nr:hypothetical protein [Desulfobacterales bacterium]